MDMFFGLVGVVGTVVFLFLGVSAVFFPRLGRPRTFFILLGISFVLFVLGMSITPEKSEKAEVETKKEHVEKEKKEKKVEKVEQTAAKEEKKEEPNNEKEVMKYTEDITLIFSDFMEYLDSFTDLTVAVGNNPLKMLETTWRQDVDLTLLSMQYSLDDLRGLTVPGEMKEAHDLILKMADEWQFVIDNFPDAVDNLDGDLINKCSERITIANRHLDQASEEILKVKKNYN